MKTGEQHIVDLKRYQQMIHDYLEEFIVEAAYIDGELTEEEEGALWVEVAQDLEGIKNIVLDWDKVEARLKK